MMAKSAAMKLQAKKKPDSNAVSAARRVNP